MSTDLYGIRVLEAKPEVNKVIIKVFVVYYEVQSKSHRPLPKDHSFFLGVLWDKGDMRFGAGGPIGDEISVDQICNESWVDKNTFKFIKNVEQITKANFPITDYTGYADFYYERNGAWENEDKLVQATYEVEVMDAKYIKHLSAGMSWGTTFYETRAVTLSYNHLSELPDMSNSLVQLRPFKEGFVRDVLFSEDKTYFFVLGSTGELACYRRENWEEVWRRQRPPQSKFSEKIECDNHKKLIWVQTNENIPKTVFNFAGEITSEKIWPETNMQLGAAHLSPSGNYFLFPPFIRDGNNNISIYDANGNFLWANPDIDGEEVRYAFFPKEEKLLALVLSMEVLKIFDLQTGEVLTDIEYESLDCGYDLSIDPTGQFFSYDETTYSRSGFMYAAKIVELASLTTIFEYGARLSPYHKDTDYVSPCIWSPDNKLVAIITKEKGKIQGKEGFVTIYPIGINMPSVKQS